MGLDHAFGRSCCAACVHDHPDIITCYLCSGFLGARTFDKVFIVQVIRGCFASRAERYILLYVGNAFAYFVDG